MGKHINHAENENSTGGYTDTYLGIPKNSSLYLPSARIKPTKKIT